jgi:hypothetical protein
MSHDLSERTARARKETWPRSGTSLNTNTVNAVQSGSSKGPGTCGSPVCSVRFDQTGMAISPKRFCCDQCKLNTWAIRKAAKLLKGYSPADVYEILMEARSE